MTYSTMYSYPSAAAFTRVSVPSTGKANASITSNYKEILFYTIIESPTTFPCISPFKLYLQIFYIPMISIFPPDCACIAILIKASADILTFLKCDGLKLIND